MQLTAQKGSASKWASHGWPRWTKFLSEQCQLHERHFTKKAPKTSLDTVGLRVGDSNTDCAEVRCMSTHAVLAMASRFCAHDSTVCLQGDGDRAVALDLLRALVQQETSEQVAQPLTWTLFLDDRCSWHPPSCPEGERRMDIVAANGMLHLRPLRESSVGLVAQVMDILSSYFVGDFEVPIVEALRALAPASERSTVHWFYRQLIWWLGSLVDERMAVTLQDEAAKPLAMQSARSQNKSLCKYWLCARQYFSKQPILHLAMDGSAVLRKPIVCGLIVRPDNVGMVFPPQVLIGRGVGSG